MRVSQLILSLQKYHAHYGDLPVLIEVLAENAIDRLFDDGFLGRKPDEQIDVTTMTVGGTKYICVRGDVDATEEP